MHTCLPSPCSSSCSCNHNSRMNGAAANPHCGLDRGKYARRTKRGLLRGSQHEPSSRAAEADAHRRLGGGMLGFSAYSRVHHIVLSVKIVNPKPRSSEITRKVHYCENGSWRGPSAMSGEQQPLFPDPTQMRVQYQAAPQERAMPKQQPLTM